MNRLNFKAKKDYLYGFHEAIKSATLLKACGYKDML